MHRKLTNKQSRSKTEKAIEKHGLYRRERARHQTMPSWVKLKANQSHLLQASNDANYYEASAKEVLYAFA